MREITKPNRSVNFIQIASLTIAIASFVFGGGFFYNEIWKSKILTYRILPQYDLGDQIFSGLVIENNGRVPITDIELVVSNLEVQIDSINMPGPHESVEIISGGVGKEDLLLQMPRLSPSSSLSIYFITSKPIQLEENITFQLTSNEVIGTPSGDDNNNLTLIMLFLFFIMGFSTDMLYDYIRRGTQWLASRTSS